MLSVSKMPATKYQMNEQKRRRKFTQEEDDLLKQLVEKLGVKKWDQIAQHVPGRTGRQCRDRYRNYLVPGYFNGQWTQEEDDLIKEKFMELGPRWSHMTRFFSNRSANAIKNRWNYFVCRQSSNSPRIGECRLDSFVADFEAADDLGIDELAFDDLVGIHDCSLGFGQNRSL